MDCQQSTDYLRHVGQMADEDVDLAAGALALANLSRPDTDPGPYRKHLDTLALDVGRATAGTSRPDDPGLAGRIASLTAVIVDRHGYRGDRETYDDLKNANLMSVIDRRRGLPIAMSILFIHAARAQGWSIDGINFPGHFLLRLRHGADAAIIDPFNEGKMQMPADLRSLIKAVRGPQAELSPVDCQPAGNKQILLRLENNIKLRLLRHERFGPAADVVDRMLLLAPQDPELWQEYGVLHARIGNMRTALSALEKSIELQTGHERRCAAQQLLTQLRSQMH
ncbi:MAG TPA: transglutaminase-like domain-containing protein [Dongiaceae bacterium]|jgi:regulator of sirC expression with transglutaminase-like and TPR domain